MALFPFAEIEGKKTTQKEPLNNNKIIIIKKISKKCDKEKTKDGKSKNKNQFFSLHAFTHMLSTIYIHASTLNLPDTFAHQPSDVWILKGNKI